MDMAQQTPTTSDCEALEALIPEYAFGLASVEEARLVERLLPACPEAAQQLAEFRQMQGMLLGGVQQVDPPTHLQARILAAAIPSAPRTSSATPHSSPAQPIVPPRRFSWPWALASAVVALLALLNVYWISQVNTLTTRLEQSNQIPTQLQNSFVLTNTSDLRTVRLPPSEESSDATAILLWNAESGIGLLYVQNFPQPTSGNTYQLWFTTRESRLSGGTFEVDAQGEGVLLINIMRPIDEFTWSRITEEPVEGSPQPGQVVLVNGPLQ